MAIAYRSVYVNRVVVIEILIALTDGGKSILSGIQLSL